jgi:hypothetical protein
MSVGDGERSTRLKWIPAYSGEAVLSVLTAAFLLSGSYLFSRIQL